LYDSSIGLVKENASINRYWLWTDNILASKALESKDITLSAKINSKVKEYAQQYNIAFRHPIGTLLKDSKAYFNTVTDTNIVGNIWYSDSNGVEELSCSEYADIAFYKAIYYYNNKQYDKAKSCYDIGVKHFDGYGFKDSAFYADGNRYSTYKLALYKIASDTLGIEDNNVDKALRIIALMQDSNTGGVYTHYREDLSIDSMTNVETTALAIMAYNSKLAKPSSGTDASNNLPIQWYIVIGMILAGVIAIILKRY
jgi:tetratricopeptide (TPR) repeat protein